MTREEILNLGLLNELKKLKKDYPNDMELGKNVRIAINHFEEKMNKLKQEEKDEIID